MTFIKKVSLVLVVGLASLLMGGCTLPFAAQQNAGLKVESNPSANVYIDDQHVGNTPFMGEKIKPGDHVVKLVSLTDPNQTYETKINLKPDVVILINREFAATPQESSSYIFDLEKTTSKDTSEITVITTPQNAIVRLDDQPKGFAPLLNMGVNPGQHKITLNAQGYKSLEISGEVKGGFRLVVTAELGKLYPLKPSEVTTPATGSATIAAASPSPSPSPSPTPTPKPSPTPSPKPTSTPKTSPTPAPSAPPKPYVEILPTSTGWLRVRSEPNGLVENEVAKVYPGEMYPYLDFNQSGWYKIEYQPGKQGWIASQYAKLVE